MWLAKKMNVTKEVAFAFLQAMETYDISWIGGDASTLLDRLTPSISDIESLGKQMQEVFDQTSIDLTARVKVSKESMRKAGYTEFSDDYATTYSTNINSGDFGLYNDDGSTYEILATPILPNGDVLSEDGLYDYIKKELANRNPKSISICTLLDKKVEKSAEVKAQYIGFEVDNVFVVGYGLDYSQKYRNLPYIGVIKEEAI